MDGVANQAGCDELYSNNVNCALYEFWEDNDGGLWCWLFSFTSGVTSVSSLRLNILLMPYPKIIVALKTH
jgi:hypothetical protein